MKGCVYWILSMSTHVAVHFYSVNDADSFHSIQYVHVILVLSSVVCCVSKLIITSSCKPTEACLVNKTAI